MEHKTKTKQKIIEYAIAFVLTVHLVSMAVLSISYGWAEWIPIEIGCMAVMNWILVIGRFQSLKVRAVFTSVFQNIAVLTYAFFIRDPNAVLIPICVITVIMGLYDVVGAIIPPIVSIFAVIGLQIFDIISQGIKDYPIFTGILFPTFNCLSICGFVIYWVCMRKKSDNALIDTIAQMQKAQDTKDDFLANVSHEIRTPINSISGLADALVQEKDPQKLTDDLYRIQTASRSLMFVVSDILDFSELESGVITLEEEEYDTAGSISDLIKMSIAQNSTEKPIELIINYPPDLPKVLIGDEKKLRRALANVLENAYKFTEEGCITIDFSYRRESYGINLMIAVRDTGIGMKPENMEKLFSNYYQADASRSRNVGGIGLGLAISRAIIQCMGGTISVFSTYQKGTEVRFVVPQKVRDYTPFITINRSEKDNVGIYFNLEQFSYNYTRDEYLNTLKDMQSNLKVKSFFCRNLAELKRREAEQHFTHIFIGLPEYQEDTEYFDRLSESIQLAIVLDREKTAAVTNKKIYLVYKPLQIMPIAQALNGTLQSGVQAELAQSHFIAPAVKVLIVDDNEMNIRVAENLIRKFKIQTFHALSGAEALKMLDTQRFDLIFMDHMMPEMDGVEALEKIRLRPGKYFKEVPVVVLTANAIAGAREMLLKEGFTDFMEKPIERAVLERVLRRNLPQEKLQEVTEEEAETMAPAANAPAPAETKQAAVEIKQANMEEKEVEEGNYTYESLNKEQGAVYCGDEAAWEEILHIYADKKSENYLPLQKLFEEEDWKNYTIMIHGVKSSMKSIGGDKLSEQARLLEMAGKEGNIDYIRQNHQHVYEMYKALVQDLMKHFGVQEEEETVSGDLPELAEDVMDRLIEDLENAMYDLDGDAMMTVLEPARGHSFHGKALNPVISTVEQKIKMSDYMSAYEVFHKIR